MDRPILFNEAKLNQLEKRRMRIIDQQEAVKSQSYILEVQAKAFKEELDALTLKEEALNEQIALFKLNEGV